MRGEPETLWKMVGVAAAYFAAAQLGGWLSAPNVFATFWPPNGLLLAALLGSARRQWPTLVLATCPANMAFDVLQGQPAVIGRRVRTSAESHPWKQVQLRLSTAPSTGG